MEDDDGSTKNRRIPEGTRFEDTIKQIIFPEPQFTDYMGSMKKKARFVIGFWGDDEDSYIRYFKTWNMEQRTEYYERQRKVIKQRQANTLASFMRRIYKDGQHRFSDFEIYIADEVIRAHRIMIACFIPAIFDKLGREQERTANKVRLDSIDLKPFKIILDYIYKGSMKPESESFIPVLETSIKMSMIEFAMSWIEMYEESFATKTALFVFKNRMARRYGWHEYLKTLNETIALDFENLISSSLFSELYYEELVDLLKCDEIGVRNEIVLFIGALKWLAFDWNGRKKYTDMLMSQIRFAYMTQEEILACCNPPILQEAVNVLSVKSLIFDCLHYQMKLTAMPELAKNPQEHFTERRYRVPLVNPLKLWSPESVVSLVNVDFDHKRSLMSRSTVEKYDTSLKKQEVSSKNRRSSGSIEVERMDTKQKKSSKSSKDEDIEAKSGNEFVCLCKGFKHKFKSECEEFAATKIQANYRGFQTKQKLSPLTTPKSSLNDTSKDSVATGEDLGSYKCPCGGGHENKLKCQEQAAIIIQSNFRGFNSRHKGNVPGIKAKKSNESIESSSEISTGGDVQEMSSTNVQEKMEPQVLVMFTNKLKEYENVHIYVVSPNPEKMTWKMMITLPNTVTIPLESLIVGNAGRIYMLGGLAKEMKIKMRVPRATNKCFKFDPLSKQLFPINRMSKPRVLHSAAVANEKIFVFGGLTKPNEPTNMAEMYDSFHDKWVALPSMTSPKYAMATVTFRKRLWILGGLIKQMNSLLITDEIEVFDLLSNKWLKLKTKLPIPLSHTTATEFNGKIYLVGGRTISATGHLSLSDKVYIFNNTTKKWTEGPNLTSPRCNVNLIVFKNKLYLMGGTEGDKEAQIKSSTCQYLEKNEWKSIDNLPVAVIGTNIVSLIHSNVWDN